MRSLGVSKRFLSLWSDSLKKYHRSESKMNKKNVITSFVFDILFFGGYAYLFIAFVKSQLALEVISIGDITVFLLAINAIYSNLDSAIKQVGNVYANSFLSKDVFDFLDLNENVSEDYKGHNSSEMISVENVSFRYHGCDNDIIKDLTLSIKNKETIAIVGENGSGKTTLVKLLMGVYNADCGVISYNENLISDKKFSVVFQDFNLYYASIIDNIKLGDLKGQSDEKDIIKLIEKTNGLNWLDKFIDKGNTVLNKSMGGIDISGGEGQRLAIARALYKKHLIIFLDEPTSAIDPLAESELYSLFEEMSENTASIIVTHRLASVKYVDKIVVLRSGQIVEYGTHSELMGLGGEYREMYELQKNSYA